jgi:hypothetical protein
MPITTWSGSSACPAISACSCWIPGLDVARAFAQALSPVPSRLSEARSAVGLPDVPALTACGFDLAAELLAAQRDFTLTLANTFAPAKNAWVRNQVRYRSSDDGGVAMPDEPADRGNFLGAFIRAQRQLANLSLRELAAMTEISNPYLSQFERGLSEPSARV